jgi:hypothetical protein
MSERMETLMLCFFCKRDVPSHDPKAKAVLCGHCVARLAGAPELPAPIQRLSYDERKAKKEAKIAKKKAKLESMKTKTRGKGKGWHLKKVFAFEGSYFSFGKEITAAEAAKLMKQVKKEEPKITPTKAGTLKPKKIKRKKF